MLSVILHIKIRTVWTISWCLLVAHMVYGLITSPETQSFGKPGQQTAKRPAAVSLVQALGSVSELEFGCENCRLRPAGRETEWDWEPQPVQLPLQVLSGPDNPPFPTPSLCHPASKLKSWNTNSKSSVWIQLKLGTWLHQQMHACGVHIPSFVWEVSAIPWQTRAHGQQCRRLSVSDAAGGHADRQRKAIGLQAQGWDRQQSQNKFKQDAECAAKIFIYILPFDWSNSSCRWWGGLYGAAPAANASDTNLSRNDSEEST